MRRPCVSHSHEQCAHGRKALNCGAERPTPSSWLAPRQHALGRSARSAHGPWVARACWRPLPPRARFLEHQLLTRAALRRTPAPRFSASVPHAPQQAQAEHSGGRPQREHQVRRAPRAADRRRRQRREAPPPLPLMPSCVPLRSVAPPSRRAWDARPARVACNAPPVAAGLARAHARCALRRCLSNKVRHNRPPEALK